MQSKSIPTELGLFFDTETTGIPNWKVPSHMPEQPHMTQLAAKVIDIPSRKVIHSMNVIIKPVDWTIPDECAELNGITTEYAMDVGITERLALEMFIEIAQRDGLNEFIKRFAFNTTFDNRIIRIALKRYMKSLTEPWKEGPYECLMIGAKKHLGLKKNPTLAEAYEQLIGTPMVGAHDAMQDVRNMMEIYYAMEGDEPTEADLFS